MTSDEIYSAILERRPSAVRGMAGFGANLLLAHADGRRGREALAALDFYVHADLFMNPTAELADVVLPVASAFEREALKTGFEVSAEAQALVQLRRRVVEPRGEARSDTEIIFELARRLGLGRHFWDGDIDAAYRAQLAPSGIALETLRENPGGVRAPVQTRYRKFAEEKDGGAGLCHADGKIELYSETLLANGYPPLPEYDEPLVSLRFTARPGRALPADPHQRQAFALLRKPTPRCRACGAWPATRRWNCIRRTQPRRSSPASGCGSRRLWKRCGRARLNDSLAPGVACGQHGWWQASEEIGAGL